MKTGLYLISYLSQEINLAQCGYYREAVAELEYAIRLLAKEVEETRRRVNALEYILLPELRETIKLIKAKLDEAERFHILRLMKIKEMFGSRGKELEG